jgi:hypothetical protein
MTAFQATYPYRKIPLIHFIFNFLSVETSVAFASAELYSAKFNDIKQPVMTGRKIAET